MPTPRDVRNATATATLEASAGSFQGACLLAGADAATAVVRTGGSGGTVIASLGAGIGLSAAIMLPFEVPFTNLHVTITGTTPKFTAFV